MELDITEKRSLPVSSDRQIIIPPKRPVFAFLGEFVLAEELEGGAGHTKSGAFRLAPTDNGESPNKKKGKQLPASLHLMQYLPY